MFRFKVNVCATREDVCLNVFDEFYVRDSAEFVAKVSNELFVVLLWEVANEESLVILDFG